MVDLNQKHIILIKELMDTNYPVSSEVLSLSLGINPKTLKFYIDESNEYLEQMAGASIVSKSGKGNYIEILDERKYKKYYQEFNAKYQGNKFLSVRNTTDSLYITRKLLFSLDYITVDQLSDKLFKARKAIFENIKSAEHILNQYHLQLHKKTGKGFKITGKESHIRIAIADYFQIDVIDSSSETYIIDFNEKEDKIYEILTNSVIRYNISIAEKSINKITKIIYISLDRYKNNIKLEEDYNTNKEVEISNEFLCSCEIFEKLGFPNIDISEKIFLSILLISRRYISDDDYIDIRKNQEVYKSSGEILDYIFYKTEVDFTLFPQFRIELARHLRGMYYRIKYGIEKRGVKVIETKVNNSYFEFAVLTTEYISKKLRSIVSEYEISYLALIFYYQQLLVTQPSKKRILIVSTEGKETCRVIAWELLNNWKKNIESISIEDSYLLDTINFEEYDLLVTDIPNLSINKIACIYVNNYLNNFDYLNLKRYFDSSEYSYYLFKTSFSRELFFDEANFETKEEIIHFIAEKNSPYIENHQDIYDIILKRDKLSSLEFTNSTVVLHSYTEFAKQTKITIIRLSKPILWNKERCRLIIFILNGKNETVPFRTLTLMKEAINDSSFTHSLVHSHDFEEMINNVTLWIDSNHYQNS